MRFKAGVLVGCLGCAVRHKVLEVHVVAGGQMGSWRKMSSQFLQRPREDVAVSWKTRF